MKRRGAATQRLGVHLTHFLHTRFSRGVAQVLICALLVTDLPLDLVVQVLPPTPFLPASVPLPLTASAQAADPILTISPPYSLISSQRFSRTQFDYTYQATVANTGLVDAV